MMNDDMKALAAEKAGRPKTMDMRTVLEESKNENAIVP
jgi:hypothetical protein